VPIAGASDREGRSRRNRHHWIAPSRGIIPIFLILIIAAHRGFNIVPFQEVYCTAMQHGSEADDGSDRGPARGLFRRAEVLVGSGDRRRRASSARGPSPTSFGRLGLTRARQPCSSGFSSMAGRSGACARASQAGKGAERVGRPSARCYERVSCVEVSMPSLCPCHPCVHAIPYVMLRARIPPVCMP
jgi:hypothetical protein